MPIDQIEALPLVACQQPLGDLTLAVNRQRLGSASRQDEGAAAGPRLRLHEDDPCLPLALQRAPHGQGCVPQVQVLPLKAKRFAQPGLRPPTQS